jgi:hypothetical protein
MHPGEEVIYVLEGAWEYSPQECKNYFRAAGYDYE